MKEPSENSGCGQLRLVINCKTKMHTLSSHVITSIREEGARTSCTLNWKLLIDDVMRSKFETNLDIYLRGPDFYRSACGFCNLSGLFFSEIFYVHLLELAEELWIWNMVQCLWVFLNAWLLISMVRFDELI